MQAPTKKIFAVFGNPILHSRSPQLFNEVFEHDNINAYYTRIQATNGKEVADIIKEHKISGANITTPFKEAVLEYVDSISDEAKQIGGINVVINFNGTLLGHNTDHLGATKPLEKIVDLKTANCLVLGAGAAARAAVFGLIQKGANVTVANRTFEKAKQIAKTFNCKAISLDKLEQYINKTDIIVSSLLPQANPLEGIILPKNLIILDANYRHSGVATYALEQDCRLISGKEWLLYQAIETYKLFFGKEPDKSIMEAKFSSNLNPENINALELNPNVKHVYFQDVDIVIYTSSSDEAEFNKRLNEEKNMLING
ncbi:MAG TPA: NAD(P)-binding domain-containing protein [Salinivirgaceae bacterium]|nr:NAD(P)-binding domain-containing protein [Salinivirgaceae bacterium]HQA76239.1 NAD(P)-binding domain-containing protein [Salinivirgaceae bacterium]